MQKYCEMEIIRVSLEPNDQVLRGGCIIEFAMSLLAVNRDTGELSQLRAS